MNAAVAQDIREPKMRTTKVRYKGKETTVGVLRRFKDYEKLTVIEAHKLIAEINAKCGTNIRLIRPGVADYLLNKSQNWKKVREGLPSPTDVYIGYEKPGRKLKAKIVFAPKDEPRLIVPTGQYKGEKNIALVLMNLTIDDFKADGKDTWIDMPDSRIVPVYDFPPLSPIGSWYMPHAKTTVPHGKEVKYSKDARVLWRDDSSYVGPLVFGVGDLYGGRKLVYACWWPSDDLGGLVEVPKGDVAKIEALAPKALLKRKTIVEIPGISVAELKGLLGRFTQDLEKLGGVAKKQLLTAGEKIEDALRRATLKE